MNILKDKGITISLKINHRLVIVRDEWKEGAGCT
jgi:hypothetical protein